MKYFLKRLLLFVMVPAVLILVLGIAFSEIIPGPKISNRYSFNEKAFKFNDFDANYLSVGSSITLNIMVYIAVR